MYPTSYVEPDGIKHDDMTQELVESLGGNTKKYDRNDMSRDYVGYNYDGDGDRDKKTSSPSEKETIKDSLNNLEEYRKYPNEAVESEFIFSQEKKTPTIMNFRDAYSEDSDIINKELKKLDAEDELIGKI